VSARRRRNAAWLSLGVKGERAMSVSISGTAFLTLVFHRLGVETGAKIPTRLRVFVKYKGGVTRLETP